MATTTTAVPMPQFLDDRPKGLLIDGQWVPAVSGKTFPAVNPSTGAVIATLAEGTRPISTWPWPRPGGPLAARGPASPRSSARTCS